MRLFKAAAVQDFREFQVTDEPRASADVSQLTLDGGGVKRHGPGRGLVTVGVLQWDIDRVWKVKITGENSVTGEIGSFHRLQKFRRRAHFTGVTGYKR